MNLMYATLAEGRDEQQLLALDRALAATPQEAEALQEKANMQALKQLQAQIGGLQPRRGR